MLSTKTLLFAATMATLAYAAPLAARGGDKTAYDILVDLVAQIEIVINDLTVKANVLGIVKVDLFVDAVIQINAKIVAAINLIKGLDIHLGVDALFPQDKHINDLIIAIVNVYIHICLLVHAWVDILGLKLDVIVTAVVQVVANIVVVIKDLLEAIIALIVATHYDTDAHIRAAIYAAIQAAVNAQVKLNGFTIVNLNLLIPGLLALVNIH